MFFINFNSYCNDLDSNFFLKFKPNNFTKNKKLFRKINAHKRSIKLEELVSNKKDSLLKKNYPEKILENILYFF